jgi:hypothetical protein
MACKFETYHKNFTFQILSQIDKLHFKELLKKRSGF